MAHIDVHEDGIDLTSPTLIEGLPGAGLVGKITADHIVDELDLTHYASVNCDGLPDVAVYSAESSDLRSPVRLHASEDGELLVLQSDVPVSPKQADEFVDCLSTWFEDHDVTPLYISGLASEKEGVPELFGVATGAAGSLLDEAGIVPPDQGGLISGPTGALLSEANERDLDAVGLIAETEAQFPDPESARVVIEHAVEPLTGVDVDTDALVERAEDIREARERLAQQMREAEEESTKAQPIRGFQ